MLHSRTAFALVLFAAASSAFAAEPVAFTKEQIQHYDRAVVPILNANCLKCHGDDPKKLKGEFDLRTRAAILRGGETGPAVDLKKPAESLLLQAINHSKDGYSMPPTGKLKDAEIRILTKWVTDGLAFPPELQGGDAPAHEPKKKTFTDEQKNYWAFKPVVRPNVPKGHANPIDAFLAAKRAEKKIEANGPADRRTLIRRATYDLIGLPATPDEIEAFVKSDDPKAYDKLIERLLASPQYGEKWGRHWLDLVRFAETNGYERDGVKPNAWRYRDYVIRSFNDDKAYDRFIREQLAGDELRSGPDDIDPVIATGYYRLGVWDDEPADPLQARFDGFDDIVTVTGQAFLGLTLNCARCHDHKGDPLLQEDYYKMVAFFRDIREFSGDRNPFSSSNQTDITPFEKRKLYEAELTERTNRKDEIKKQMTAIEDEVIKTFGSEDQRAAEGLDRPKVVAKVPAAMKKVKKAEYDKLMRELERLQNKPSPHQEFALSLNNCDPKPPATFVNIRGNPHVNGAEVKPGFPAVLNVPDPAIKATERSSGRRTALANWIADPKNPLTARVLVNRLWQHHFGKALVPTSNDFGKLGEGVSNPLLLDWLADEFVHPSEVGAKPWTLKRMHRLLMTSDAYRRSSAGNAANLRTDPSNGLWWRYPQRRLTAEEVRDSVLRVSGQLNSKMYGPSMYPKLPDEVLAGISFGDKKNHWPDSSDDERRRRTVYSFVKRSIQVPILIAHDQADPDNSCPVRYATTVPTQALGMLNGEFTNDSAAVLAGRLKREAGNDLAKQAALGIRLTTGRDPKADEVAKDVAFIELIRTKHKLNDDQARTQYALLLLNANEFLYLD